MTGHSTADESRRVVNVLGGAAALLSGGLFLFLAFFCPDRQLVGLVPAALWVPLVLWFFWSLRRRQIVSVGIAFPVSALVMVLTIITICPDAAIRTAIVIGAVAFVVYGLILAAGVASFEEWSHEED